MKLGCKATSSFGLGGSASAIYSHSQQGRDLFVLVHAADFRWARGRFNSVEWLRRRGGMAANIAKLPELLEAPTSQG